MKEDIEPFYLFMPKVLESAIVVSIPHSGNFVPKEFLNNIRLSKEELRLSEDSYTDEIFSSSLSLNIPTIRANYSRNYIDVNREPFELKQKMFIDKLPSYINHNSIRAEKGFGTIPEIVSKGKKIYKDKLTFAEVKERIRNIYHPYHDKLEEVIKLVNKKFGFCILIDAHSMPSSKKITSTDFVLGNNYNQSCTEELTNLISSYLQSIGYKVSYNFPYPGGYTTKHYGYPELGVEAIQIEINRSLYMNEVTFLKHDNFNKLKKDIFGLLSSIKEYTQSVLK